MSLGGMRIPDNIVRRRVDTRAYVDNQEFTIDLPRGFDYWAIYVRVHGTIQIATAAATAIRNLGPAWILESAELKADGNAAIFAGIPGNMMVHANYTQGFARPNFTAPGLTVATHPVSVVFCIPLANWNGPRPKDTALHSTLPFMSLLQLRLRMNAVSTWLTPDATTVFTPTMQVDTYVDQVEEFFDEGAAESRFLPRHSFQSITVDADNSNLEVDLPVGGGLKAITMLSLDDTSQAVDTVINNARVKSGLDVRQDNTWDDIRAYNQLDYMAAIGDMQAGFGIADMTPTGQLTKVYDLTDVSEAKLVLDVTRPAGGNGSINLDIHEIFFQPDAASLV